MYYSRAGAGGTRQGIDRSDRPVFETGDPRYSWINEVQAAGKRVLSADKTRLDYEIYDLRYAQGLRDRNEPLHESFDRRAINGKSARSRHDQEPNERPYKISDPLLGLDCA